jgi:H+-transporting ATPase
MLPSHAHLLSPAAAAAAAAFLSCVDSKQCTGSNTFFGKTATMLQSAGGIGHLQKILMSIVIALVAISLVLCITMLGYLLGYGKEPFKEALTFVVVVLVVSIPIAIEIVCTTTLALGSRELSGHGAIVTRLASIEEMAGMNMVSSCQGLDTSQQMGMLCWCCSRCTSSAGVTAVI